MKITALIILAIALLAMGCANVPKVSYQRSQSLAFPDSVSSEQTINGISINIKLFDVGKEMQKPMYKKKFNILYTPYFNPIWEKFDRQINLFMGTTPFEVTITNTTDQILKLEETRVMYIDPIVDTPTEPYMALDLAAISQVPSILPVYQQVIDSFDSVKPQNNDFMMQVGNEIRNLAQQQKFVNAPKREIMPGMKYTGIIIIPIAREKITQGKLSFIDVVTKSATAGYAEEKVRFDFIAKNVTKYWKLDKALNPGWVEISGEEYWAGK